MLNDLKQDNSFFRISSNFGMISLAGITPAFGFKIKRDLFSSSKPIPFTPLF
jgi:hypothetical protein